MRKSGVKKLFIILVALTFIPVSMADSSANIKIKMKGAGHNNRYFLCLPDVGCLSMLAAKKGKVFPIFHPIQMNNIYVMDVNNHFKVFNQGLPSSCNVTVQQDQSITISGNITLGAKNSVIVNQLHCSVN